MNQNYNFKSIDIAQKSTANDNHYDYSTFLVFEEAGHQGTKTVDFQQTDGRKQNFNYAHYITAWIASSEDDETKGQPEITVVFASHTVHIKGYCLDKIYDLIRQNILKICRANDARYLETSEENTPFITAIDIKWRGKDEE